MKLTLPKYYKDFKCRGGACTDNCCIGWEIDINDEAYKKYCEAGGDFGDRLKSSIFDDGNCRHFILDGERCPFLNDDNLCELILKFGDDYLCDICREHPRYYSVFGNHAFGGIGLCCEAAAELILSEDNRHKYIDINKENLDCEEFDSELFDCVYGKKQIIIDILSDNGLKTSEKFEKIYKIALKLQEAIDEEPQKPLTFEVPSISEYFSTLEKLSDELGEIISSAKCKPQKASELSEKYTSNICIYFIDRYLLSAVYDGNVIGRVVLAILSAGVLKMIFESEEVLDIKHGADAAKCYSKEIEYSEENIARIINDPEARALAELFTG